MHRQVLKVCETVRAAGGRAVLVGGWVRDRLHGFESKDFDIEVYGLDAHRLRSVLESIARVNTVGEHFSVYKLVFQRRVQGPANDSGSKAPDENDERVEIDVSIPRRESKSGRGSSRVRDRRRSGNGFRRSRAATRFHHKCGYVRPADWRNNSTHTRGSGFQAAWCCGPWPPILLSRQSSACCVRFSSRRRFEMVVEPATAELCRTSTFQIAFGRIWVRSKAARAGRASVYRAPDCARTRRARQGLPRNSARWQDPKRSLATRHSHKAQPR